MKSAILVIAVFALLAGCSRPRATPAANVVPEEQLSAFLAQVKTQDYHDVAREGRALLKAGLVIPDHKTKLKAFLSGNPEKGQVRYELMSFQGEQGGYGINLFLKEETGAIIKFDAFEWWR
jgi:hypothetical protein